MTQIQGNQISLILIHTKFLIVMMDNSWQLFFSS